MAAKVFWICFPPTALTGQADSNVRALHLWYTRLSGYVCQKARDLDPDATPFEPRSEMLADRPRGASAGGCKSRVAINGAISRASMITMTATVLARLHRRTRSPQIWLRLLLSVQLSCVLPGVRTML